jgi:hypothetical protein
VTLAVLIFKLVDDCGQSGTFPGTDFLVKDST